MSIPTYIIGTGGLGRGVAETIKVLSDRDRNWTFAGFIDDDSSVVGTSVNGMEVVGDTDYLLSLNAMANVVIAIANPEIKSVISQKLSQNAHLLYPNIVHPSVNLNSSITMGIGNIISENVVFSANVSIGDFALIHFNCTIGHDVQIGDHVTVYPGVNLSGYSKMEPKSQAGTNSSILPQVTVGEGAVVGAGSMVNKNTMRYATVVGIPAKEMKN